MTVVNSIVVEVIGSISGLMPRISDCGVGSALARTVGEVSGSRQILLDTRER